MFYLDRLPYPFLIKVFESLEYIEDKENFVDSCDIPHLHIIMRKYMKQRMIFLGGIREYDLMNACEGADDILAMDLISIYGDYCCPDLVSANDDDYGKCMTALNFAIVACSKEEVYVERCDCQYAGSDSDFNDCNSYERIVSSPYMENVVLKMISKYGKKCLPGHKGLFNMTPLMQACRMLSTKIAIKLIEEFKFDCLPQLCSLSQEKSAFNYACQYGLVDVAIKMIQVYGSKCLTEQENRDDMTIFMVACSYGKGLVAMKMMDIYGSGCNFPWINKKGKSAFSLALGNDLYDVAMRLLSDEFKIDAFSYIGDQSHENNDLCRAIAKKKEQMAIRIIDVYGDRCCPVYMSAQSHFTVLHASIFLELNNVAMKLLRTFGKKVKPYQVSVGFNPMALACANGLCEVVEYLLDHFGDGMRHDFASEKGYNTIMWCCKIPDNELVLRIIDNCYRGGCSPKQISETGDTPLLTIFKERYHIAHNEEIIIKLLDTFGDDCMPEFENRDGKNAMFYARKYEYNKVISILQNDYGME